MATTYCIVYSTASSAIRRIIADDEGQVTVGVSPNAVPSVICSHAAGPHGYHHLASGESALSANPPSAIRPAGPADWITAVRNATGVTPPIMTCALIDNTNTVTGIINAEVGLDPAPPGVPLMVQCYSPAITIGCTYDSGTGLFTTPAGTIPPGTPGNSTGSPITVPPAVIPKP